MENELLSIRFKQLPVRLHMTDKEFAGKIGVSQNMFCRYKSGDATPSSAILVKIKTLFNIDMNWFCDIKSKDDVVTKQIVCKYKECCYCGA